MDYLDYFGLHAEPFSNAPVPRYYYASRQHTEALTRLTYAAHSMKGLALLVGEIGHGKTTLARRMLDSLPGDQYEAAMLVIVHAGITPNWLLKRIAIQLGVVDPADEKLEILSQLYNRLMEIHQSGKKAVVLIDEAQMLASRELMEEFRGLLNLEVPGRKLISFVFFGLPEIENNLQLDPPLAQRVAMRYKLLPFGEEDAGQYVQHRWTLSGGQQDVFPQEALKEVYFATSGVPRLINTLVDNVLLEMFFSQSRQASPELIAQCAENLGMIGDKPLPPSQPLIQPERPAFEGSEGHDAIIAVSGAKKAPTGYTPDADAIAARVAVEVEDVLAATDTASLAKQQSYRGDKDIEDPLSYLKDLEEPVYSPSPMSTAEYDDIDVDVDDGDSLPTFRVEQRALHRDDSEPEPKPKPSAPRAERKITTSSGRQIDLTEIDDLIADLKGKK